MNVDIAGRLAKRRRDAGYSQEGLAEKLGVSRQAISKWERSESSPDTDNLIALAQLYGVSIDELLYVDESFEDDVAFEAFDKAQQRKDEAAQGDASDAPVDGGSASEAASASGEEARGADTARAQEAPEPETENKFNIGFDGIHIKDGEDYVHVSWKDGVHMKDSADGDEVHVGWDGIHVQEGRRHGKPQVHFSGADKQGESFAWDGDGVVVNGRHYDSWKEAHQAFSDRYGMERAWLKFPFPMIVIIVYVMLGVFLSLWVVGLFLFALIPVYYMIGHAAYEKRLAPLLEGLYPLACLVWFLWMVYIGQPHPAWLIFLTIPVVEWAFHEVKKALKRRKTDPETTDAA